jgi:hypothetical protein
MKREREVMSRPIVADHPTNLLPISYAAHAACNPAAAANHRRRAPRPEKSIASGLVAGEPSFSRAVPFIEATFFGAGGS